MTTRMRRLEFLLAALAVVAILPAGFVHAEDEDEIEGEFTFGPQYIMEDQAQDSAKFLEYREVPNGFWSERFQFTWRPSTRSYLDLDVRDMVQKDQIKNGGFGVIVPPWYGEKSLAVTTRI